jgi:CDP-glucose 4,6-dehydratase
MVINDEFWKGKKVFITGHTGFKGSWLTIWLNELGVETFGFSIDKPSKRNLYDEAGVDLLTESTVGDIRDIDALKESLLKFKPDIVFHLAAQPLVRFSYENPVTTYETNVMGTLNLLEVSRQVESISAVINITTDKCYENKEQRKGYKETDPMGGFDPYSNSKACSELISSSYYKSFYIKDNIGLATARSGNVLGGGDWAKDRLVPDLFRAYRKDENLFIRNPQSTRPWQHVLEPLSGYLLLAENLYKEPKKWSQGWNFGPHAEDAKEVGWIVNFISDKLNIQKKWELDKGVHPHEANFLHLDTEKAQNELGWKPKWNLVEALMKVIEWNLSWQNQSNAFDLCKEQINEYQEK